MRNPNDFIALINKLYTPGLCVQKIHANKMATAHNKSGSSEKR